MSLWTRLVSRWRTRLHRGRVERELDEEIRGFVDGLAAKHERAGMDPASARRAALVETGGVEQVKEHVRDARSGRLLDTTVLDLRYAWRALWKSPGFAAAVILTLALGIGANSAIFTIVKTLLIEPLPYRDADRLVFVWADLTTAGYPRGPLAGPELNDLRERTTLFSGFGGIWANTAALTGDNQPEQLRIGLVTTNFFQVLGVDAALGRTFAREDETTTSPPPILLSWALWQRRYGGDPAIVGRRILVNNVPAPVIGVMPASFRLLMPADASVPDDLQAWRPLNPNVVRGPRGQQFLRVVGRMRPGVTLAQARKEVASVGDAISRSFVDYGGSGWTLFAVDLQADGMREVRPAVLALFAGVSVLLLMACVNVASLLIARAAARGGETALRMALGASRGRLFRQYFVEGVILAALGALASAPVAWGLLRGLLRLRPEALSRIDGARLDPAVFAFACAIALTWGLLFSLAPLAEVCRTNIRGALQHETPRTGGRLRYGLRTALVVVQVALGGVLLVSAGLLARTVINLQRVDPGFRSSGVMTFRIAPGGRFRGADALNAFSRRVDEELAALPGVSGVGAISHLPYDNLPNWSTPYRSEGVSDPAQSREADSRAVTPGFFAAVGARLIEGRTFTEADDQTKPFVAVVDDRLAGRLWPGQSAIGRRVTGDPRTTGTAATPFTVIGVVSHLRHRELTRDVREQIYFAERQVFRSPMAYVLKMTTDPAGSAAAIRAAIAKLDPQLPVYDVRPLDEYVRSARAATQFTTTLTASFAAAALVLAGLGVYGVVAYAVAQRRHEFGVRIALGASPGQVMRVVMRDGVRLGAMGLPLGLAGAIWAASLLQAQLYGVTPHDAISYLAAAPVLIAATLLACWLPARRATAASPLDALRAE